MAISSITPNLLPVLADFDGIVVGSGTRYGRADINLATISGAEDAAGRAEDAAGRAEVAAATLESSANVFWDYDYIDAAEIVKIRANDVTGQVEATVTAGLRAMHDAGMAWVRGAAGRSVIFRYSGTYAVNDELFSETFAGQLWTIGFATPPFSFIADGEATFKVKNWIEQSRIRRRGPYAVVNPLGEVSSGGTGPIVVVGSGQSNLVGPFGATDGTFKVNPNVRIWDAALSGFQTANIATTSYQISFNLDTAERKTVGGGRNNAGMAFCHRLAEETGRPVYYIANGFGGLSITNWMGSGTLSQLYRALKKDIVDALAAIGASTVHYFLWQQGEADAADTAYGTKVQTLLTQLRSETFWNATGTYFIAGEPCQNWTSGNLANLLAEVREIETDGSAYTLVARSIGLPYLPIDANIHFSGAGLWAMGYGRYYQALGSNPAQMGVGDPVPTAMFRWEQQTGYQVGPLMRGLRFEGTQTDTVQGDDPIGMKILRANSMQMQDVTVRDIRNIGRMMEGVVNSREVQCTIEGSGYQPTNSGGTGFISPTARFSVTGTAITSTEAVFTADQTGKIFLIDGAGPNGHVHRAFFTYVSPTSGTLSAAASVDVTNRPGSFAELTGTIGAGSRTLVLNSPTAINYVGRYVMVLFAGSTLTPDYDHLVTRVTAQVGETLTLASPARFATIAQMVVVAPADFIGRTTDDWTLNGGRQATASNDIQAYGHRNENPNYQGRGSALNLFVNDAFNVAFVGGKWHGQPPIYNNFGSNCGIIVADNCDGLLLDAMQLKWGKYSGTLGSIVVSGKTTRLVMPNVQIGNAFATNNARHFHIQPRADSTSWTVLLSGLDQSGNGWPNTNQGLARYGANGSVLNFAALGPLLQDGIAPGENTAEPIQQMRHVELVKNMGIGMIPSDNLSIKQSVFHAADMVPREMFRGADRWFETINATGFVLGQTFSGTTTYPFAVDWSAPGNSLVVKLDFVQIRKPRLTGLPSYANNAAAITGGLVAGDTYLVSASNPRQLAVVF